MRTRTLVSQDVLWMMSTICLAPMCTLSVCITATDHRSGLPSASILRLAIQSRACRDGQRLVSEIACCDGQRNYIVLLSVSLCAQYEREHTGLQYLIPISMIIITLVSLVGGIHLVYHLCHCAVKMPSSMDDPSCTARTCKCVCVSTVVSFFIFLLFGWAQALVVARPSAHHGADARMSCSR